MKLIIDDANIEKVREIWDLYPCDGVTTNPSILAKSKRPPYEVLSELREIVGKDGELHVQLLENVLVQIHLLKSQQHHRDLRQ